MALYSAIQPYVGAMQGIWETKSRDGLMLSKEFKTDFCRGDSNASQPVGDDPMEDTHALMLRGDTVLLGPQRRYL